MDRRFSEQACGPEIDVSDKTATEALGEVGKANRRREVAGEEAGSESKQSCGQEGEEGVLDDLQ